MKAWKPGSAAYDSEQTKIRKYEQKCIECGCRFEPLVVEDQGRLGDRSRIIINELISKVQERRGDPADGVDTFNKRFWTAKIVMALHRAACTAVSVRINNIITKRKSYAGSVDSDAYLDNEEEHYCAARLGLRWGG